jgi:hypothetical protein
MDRHGLHPQIGAPGQREKFNIKGKTMRGQGGEQQVSGFRTKSFEPTLGVELIG